MQGRTIVKTFVAQSKDKPLHHALLLLSPSSRSGISLDRLFIIAEIPLSRSAGNTRIESARLFGSQLFNHYKECKSENEQTDICFEKLIEWANRHIDQFIELKQGEQAHTMMIGCISGEKLFFSVSGSPSALIYFKDAETFRDLDLIKIYGGGERENSHAPFFFTLISGELHADNYVLVSTAPLSDFLQPDYLQNLITENDGGLAVESLSKQLATDAPHLAVAGLLISIPGVHKKIPKVESSFTLSTASIKRLIHQGQTTERFLNISLFAKLKTLLLPHLMPRVGNKEKISFNHKKNTFSAGAVKGGEPFSAAKFALNANQILQKILFKIGYFLVSGTQCAAHMFRSPTQERRALINGLRNATSTSVSKWKTRFAALTKKQRLIIGFGTIGTLIIALNIAGFAMRSANVRAQATYTAHYNAIKEKLDGIESMIIYNNIQQSRIEAQNTQMLITEFPADTTKHKTTRDEFQRSLNSLMLRLRHLTSVTPFLIADFSALNSNELTKLISGGGYITAIGGNDTHAVTSNTATQETKSIESPLLGRTSAIAARDTQDFIAAIEGKRLINIKMPSNAITSLETIWSDKQPLIRALAFYNNKLYVVDGAEGKITKHSTASTGFGKGADWLRKPLNDLKEASAMAIDGSIYVGTQNGTLYKFTNGAGGRVSLDLLDPQLKTVTALYTAKNSLILFILDAAEKRVVLWDKKGALKAQYTAAEFENAKDFAVDEHTKEITVLAGAKVWKFKY